MLTKYQLTRVLSSDFKKKPVYFNWNFLIYWSAITNFKILRELGRGENDVKDVLVSGYFRIRNFFVPDTTTVHTFPANSTANPEKNKYALQSGKKYIRNESDNVWTGESGYFFIR